MKGHEIFIFTLMRFDSFCQTDSLPPCPAKKGLLPLPPFESSSGWICDESDGGIRTTSGGSFISGSLTFGISDGATLFELGSVTGVGEIGSRILSTIGGLTSVTIESFWFVTSFCDEDFSSRFGGVKVVSTVTLLICGVTTLSTDFVDVSTNDDVENDFLSTAATVSELLWMELSDSFDFLTSDSFCCCAVVLLLLISSVVFPTLTSIPRLILCTRPWKG